jgi:hypothetical protein
MGMDSRLQASQGRTRLAQVTTDALTQTHNATGRCRIVTFIL